MPSRRAVLQGGVAGLAIAAAGCLERGRETTTDGDWHYDAAERFEAGTVAAVSVDFAAIRAGPLPELADRAVADFDREVESIDLEDVETLAATAYFDGEAGAGGSMAVLGEYDVEAVGEELTAEGLEAVEPYRDVDRYEADQSLAIGVDASALVVGVSDTSAAEGLDLVDAALDARAGALPAFDERPNGATLQAELGGDAAVAVDLGDDIREELSVAFERSPGPLGTIVGAVEAFGIDVTLREETSTLTYLLVADPEELDVETVREVTSEITDADATGFRSASVSRDGRAIVVEAEAETDTLLESHLGLPYAMAPQPQQPRSIPQVALHIERTADGHARITHQGGDTVETPLSVFYEGRDRQRTEEWRAVPITTGDSYVTDHEVAADGVVQVMWESPDGSNAALLGRAQL